MTDIIALAFSLSEAVERLLEHARQFCYSVALWGHDCIRCHGRLVMIGESRCQCEACRFEFDPTLSFQRCTACGGRLRLRVCRYECRACGRDARSRFAFEARVFDRDYFRQKMAESRERQRQLREEREQAVVSPCSGVWDAQPADLNSIPGLIEALNGLVAIDAERLATLAKNIHFDLSRYQTHLEAHTGAISVSFDDIPPLEEDSRLDRIWRFIALIYMAHEGLIQLTQDGPGIMVKRNDLDRQGSGILGDAQALDGVA